MMLPNKLYKEIADYCKLNSIDNVEDYVISLITNAFTIEKYGRTPFGINNKKSEPSTPPSTNEGTIKTQKDIYE